MSLQYIDGYEIVAEIGQGGMAAVYRAQDPKGGPDVAVKVLRREFLTDLGFRARFQREARTIAALQHPAVVPVLDFGQHEEQLYLVMPHMPGGSLAMRLPRGVLSPQEAGEVLARIATALDAAHEQGMVHRDLKPSNILFDAEGEAYLADFGIAVQTAAGDSAADVIDGTPAYMSPEQCRPNANIDGRGDIYSLGVTLYEMLTGRVPFEADTALAILTQHLYRPAPSLRSANPALPATLEPVLHKALAKDPAARDKTAGALSKVYEQKLVQALEESIAPGTASTPAPAEDAVVANVKVPEATGEAAQMVLPAPEVAEDIPAVKAPTDDQAVVGVQERLRAGWLRLGEAYEPWLREHFYLTLALVGALGVACAVAAVMALRSPGRCPGPQPGAALRPRQRCFCP